MIRDKKIIAIIPARGGSKGLPKKNIKDLCGKPLIGWTIDKAKKSKYIDTILVTTDCHEIASIAREYGAEVPFFRPIELAIDTASTSVAVEHAIRYYKEVLHKEFDIIVLLEPTSPLREDNDIDCMLDVLIEDFEDSDSIISIGEVGEHPSIIKKKFGKRVGPFVPDLEMKCRRQDNIPAYFPYGVAYIAKMEVFLKEKSFYTKRSLFHEIQRYQCYEIDDIYDFLAVENIMKFEWDIA